MIEWTVEELTPIIGTRPACRAVGACQGDDLPSLPAAEAESATAAACAGQGALRARARGCARGAALAAVRRRLAGGDLRDAAGTLATTICGSLRQQARGATASSPATVTKRVSKIQRLRSCTYRRRADYRRSRSHRLRRHPTASWPSQASPGRPWPPTSPSHEDGPNESYRAIVIETREGFCDPSRGMSGFGLTGAVCPGRRTAPRSPGSPHSATVFSVERGQRAGFAVRRRAGCMRRHLREWRSWITVGVFLGKSRPDLARVLGAGGERGE